MLTVKLPGDELHFDMLTNRGLDTSSKPQPKWTDSLKFGIDHALTFNNGDPKDDNNPTKKFEIFLEEEKCLDYFSKDMQKIIRDELAKLSKYPAQEQKKQLGKFLEDMQLAIETHYESKPKPGEYRIPVDNPTYHGFTPKHRR